MFENKHIDQIFITFTSGYIFLMQFCENSILIVENVSIMFREKYIHLAIKLDTIERN